MTDDAAHTSAVLQCDTIAHNRAFGVENTDSFAVYPYFIGRIECGSKRDIPNT